MTIRPVMMTLGLALALTQAAPGQPRMPKSPNGADRPLPQKVLPWISRNGTENVPEVAWMVSEGFVLRAEPDSDEMVVGGKPVLFLTKFNIADYYQGRKQKWWLLAMPQDTIDARPVLAGWAPEETLFLGKEAVRDPTTSIHRKALLVNTRASLHREGANAAVALRAAPDEKATERARYQLSNYLFVWGETRDREWILLGTNYALPEGEKPPEEVIKGWARMDRTMPWLTRQAVEWDRPENGARKIRAKVFADWKKALDFGKRGFVGADENDLFFEEQFGKDGQPRAFLDDEPRFPALGLTGDTEERDLLLGQNRLVRVGFVGGMEGGRGVVTTKRDSEEITRFRRRLNSISAQSKRLEIVFAIDETDTMRNWYKPVAEVVRKIVDDAKEQSNDVWMAVSYYADDVPPAVPARATRLVDARVKGDEVFRNLMKRARDPDDVVGGGDPLEMVFNGIKEAVVKSERSPLARKLLVVVGDAGDRADPNAPGHPPESELAKLLAPDGQAPFELLAIRVFTRGDDDEGRRFAHQMGTLARLLNERAGERIARVEPLWNSPSFTQALGERYVRLKQDAKAIEVQLAELARGNFKAHIKPGLLKLLKERTNIDDFLKSDAAQLCEPGFVWMRNEQDQPNLRFRALLNGGDVDSLLAKINKVANARPGSSSAMADLVVETIRQQTTGSGVNLDGSGKGRMAEAGDAAKRTPKEGDDPERISLAQALLQREGLTARSELLTKTPAQLRSMTPRELDRLRASLRRKYLILSDVRNSKQRKYTLEEVDDQKRNAKYWEVRAVGDVVDRDRTFKLPGNEDVYYWLDVEDELP